jgi:hypothetical protein
VKWSVSLVALALAGHCARSDPDATPSAVAPAGSTPRVLSQKRGGLPLDLIDALPRCDVDHEGLFLDVGTPAVEARRDHVVGPFRDTPVYERAGATFARVHSRRLAYEFAVLAPLHKVSVSVRLMGVISRQVSVYLDDRRVGALLLSRDEPTIVATPPIDELTVGTHTVTLRFGGGAQGADEPYAEVDWIRVGSPLATPVSYAPPTLRDIVTDVVLDGEPRRAIVLRSPGAVRCAVRVSPGMVLRTRLGFWGNGQGTAVVRVLEDGEPPQLLVERKVVGATGATWEQVALELERFVGRVVAVELSSLGATGGGRVAFGEPGISGAPDDLRAPAARIVVVVVAAGLDRRLIPPWGPVGGFPAIAKLARDGVAFDRYRVPTTVVGGVMASLLTGISPRAHGVEDPYTRLSDEIRLLGERAAEGSAHAALMTAVPMSFPPFGLDRGWDRYEPFSPVKDVPATEPYARGTAWLKEQLSGSPGSKLLLVVHGRGGHPPWDITRDEVAQLPPEEYSGPVEPRAGAIVLSSLRGLKGADQRLSGDDWRRLHALEEAALRKEDVALRRVLDGLEQDGLYDSAMIVFMGDVATGDAPAIPFGAAPPLREDNLLAPLIVKFPKNVLGGTAVGAMATTTDVTATIVHALGLDDAGLEGVDLLRLAKGGLPLDGHAVVATLGTRYSTRWGPWLLSGEFGRRPSLCSVDVDPSCVTDAFAQSPFAAQALFGRTYQIETIARATRARAAHPAARVVPDADTQAALKVFGY